MKAIKLFFEAIYQDELCITMVTALGGYFIFIFILFVFSLFMEVSNWQKEVDCE